MTPYTPYLKPLILALLNLTLGIGSIQLYCKIKGNNVSKNKIEHVNSLSIKDPTNLMLIEKQLNKFGNIEFEINSAQISGIEAQSKLDSIVERMTKIDSLTIEVHGHTDSTGNPESNKILSRQRAESVKSHLIDCGFNENRILTYGHGASIPIASNKSQEGRKHNRRIEYKLIPQLKSKFNLKKPNEVF